MSSIPSNRVKNHNINPDLLNFHWSDNFFRRLIDIICAIVGLIFLLPFFLLIAVLIKSDSPGPSFYRGLRMGKGGKPFSIIKFRTMYERPESYAGPSVTAEDDNRITPIGKFLRDSKLNELPQLWNVLLGEMSLVGPRPEAVEIAAEWPEDVRKVITSVRPGITSPASIVYRSEEKLLSQDNLLDTYFSDILPSKLRLDMLYVKNRSLLTDLDVIFWTAVALLPQMREKEIRENRLFWGPLSHFVTRFLNWYLIDLVVSILAVGVAGFLWRLNGPLNLGWQNALLAAGFMALVFSLFNVLLKVNHITWSRAAAGDVLYLAGSTLFSTLILIALRNFLLPYKILPSGFIIISGVLAFMGFVFFRYRERLMTGAASRWIRLRQGAATTGEKVLVVGAGDNGELALWMLHRPHMLQAFTIVGIVDDDLRKQGMSIDGVRVIGTTKDISALVVEKEIDMIVFTICRMRAEERQNLLATCQQTAARIFVMPDLMQACKIGGKQPLNRFPSAADDMEADYWQDYINYLTHLVENEKWDMLRSSLQDAQDRELGQPSKWAMEVSEENYGNR